MALPSRTAACRKAGSLPGDEPQKTQTDRNLGNLVLDMTISGGERSL
jgi:hypothetical protein